MKKNTTNPYCKPMLYPVKSNLTTAVTSENKNFKQELIKVLLLEVKKTTDVIEKLNTQLFSEEGDQETASYLPYVVYQPKCTCKLLNDSTAENQYEQNSLEELSYTINVTPESTCNAKQRTLYQGQMSNNGQRVLAFFFLLISSSFIYNLYTTYLFTKK